VQDPVAHGLRLGLGQCPFEAEHLAPGQQCPGDHGGGHPGFVGMKAVVASTARQAVAIEATGPNSTACSRRDARSARQSAPSAMATARWVRTMPGSWVCQLIPQPAMAPDIASVRPLRSASSDNNAVPGWDTRFFPSVVTCIDRVARLSSTFKEPSSWFRFAALATAILPGQEGFPRKRTPSDQDRDECSRLGTASGHAEFRKWVRNGWEPTCQCPGRRLVRRHFH